jgi:hypothetical protein
MENNGRYQAITLGKEALILDTQEGHLWLWGVRENGNCVLIYQGQVSPGQEMGEIIDQFPSEKENK